LIASSEGHVIPQISKGLAVAEKLGDVPYYLEGKPPKNMYEKLTKCPNFTLFLPEKLAKYPNFNFYDICPKS